MKRMETMEEAALPRNLVATALFSVILPYSPPKSLLGSDLQESLDGFGRKKGSGDEPAVYQQRTLYARRYPPGSLLECWNESMKNRGGGARIMQRRACWGVGRLICQAAPSALPSRSTLRPAWQARGLVWSQLRPVGVALTVGHARGFHSTFAGFQAGGEDDALHSRSENRAPAAHTNGQRHSELQVRCHAMTSCFPRECLGIRAHLHMHRGAMEGRRRFPWA